MKSSLRSLTAFALVAGLALPLAAADPAKKADKEAAKAAGKKHEAASAAMYKLPETITLTDAQQAKVKEIEAKYKPKAAALQKDGADMLTAEQKKARHDAMAAAKDAGKKGKAAQADVEAALNLTPEQKRKMEEARVKTATLRTEMQAEVVALLTPEQKEALPKPKKADAKPKKTKKPE